MSHSKTIPNPRTTTSSAFHGGESSQTTIADVHDDVLRKHVFTRLDGPSLASTGCTCSRFHSLISADDNLWSDTCLATWPSTDTPRLRHVISSFPAGPRSFFSDSFPLIASPNSLPNPNPANRTPELVSAVDVHHRGSLVFSKAVETETASGWFRNSPFRIDLLDPKEAVATAMEYPDSEEKQKDLTEEIALSWIVIDAAGRRAANVSSGRAVSVERHWLNGEVEVRFAAVVGGGEKGTAAETVMCGIVVTCGGEMQVKGVSLQVEDMEGKHLNGRDSLGILERLLEGKMGRKVLKSGEAKMRYEDYLERKRERRERKVRAEGRLDKLCAGFTVFVVSVLCFLLYWRYISFYIQIFFLILTKN